VEEPYLDGVAREGPHAFLCPGGWVVVSVGGEEGSDVLGSGRPMVEEFVADGSPDYLYRSVLLFFCVGRHVVVLEGRYVVVGDWVYCFNKDGPQAAFDFYDCRFDQVLSEEQG